MEPYQHCSSVPTVNDVGAATIDVDAAAATVSPLYPMEPHHYLSVMSVPTMNDAAAAAAAAMLSGPNAELLQQTLASLNVSMLEADLAAFYKRAPADIMTTYNPEEEHLMCLLKKAKAAAGQGY
jgi:hypothetical protein